MLKQFENSGYWDTEWVNKFEHYQQDLRHAYYINAIINDDEKSILELGAGSFRDFARLNELGRNCFACDFSKEAVNMAKKQFPRLQNKITCDNAFDTNFSDNQFDLTYHNGFWGCFTDADLNKLAKEQARISKKRMMFTLHNAHNKDFAEYFKVMSKKDDFYKLRFFEIDEAKEFVKDICSDVKIIPVGKGKKYYEDDLINIGLFNAEYIKQSFDYHKTNLLTISERLLCIGTLKSKEEICPPKLQ